MLRRHIPSRSGVLANATADLGKISTAQRRDPRCMLTVVDLVEDTHEGEIKNTTHQSVWRSCRPAHMARRISNIELTMKIITGNTADHMLAKSFRSEQSSLQYSQLSHVSLYLIIIPEAEQ
jgi:hypothetical protein